MSLVVEDPRKVLATLEELVVEAGGFVTSASSYSSSESIAYANLSARVPPDMLPALRRAVLDLALQVQNDSMSSQDITHQYRSLLESQAELARFLLLPLQHVFRNFTVIHLGMNFPGD